MRPVGDVSAALVAAARELHNPERSATLAELAAKASVGRGAARRAVDNLCRAGKLHIVRRRSVAYRNRPVAEYEPCGETPSEAAVPSGILHLGDLLAAWGR
jgi:hypothetical protein